MRDVVNMAEARPLPVQSTKDRTQQAEPRCHGTIDASPLASIDPVLMIELLYFAYRDFTSESDRVLAEFEFGRAHHRVLHFVNRQPGLRVADLLEILNITKQSLARVLKQLIEEGFVEQHAGEVDRRERHLYATPAGQHLAERLLASQVERVGAAAQLATGCGPHAIQQFLIELIDRRDRPKVAQLLQLAGVRSDPSRGLDGK